MYIGNDLQVAESGNKIIDDISSSFNGSTTSFALLVGGAAPVPFPINTQQIYISVNGVIQEPDPTGSAGFKLLGNNIVFSSAPANGHAFFGVILSGADYVTVGTEFPAGSATAPSITFSTDSNSGLYSVTGGTMGFTSDGVQTFTMDGDGFNFPDDKKVQIGSSDDLQLYHSSGNSFITNATGTLKIRGSVIELSAPNAEAMLQGTADAALNLYHNGLLKFATTATGTNVTGIHVDDGATHDGDVTFTGASANVVWDKSADDLTFNDNAKAAFGTSSDLVLHHDGSHSYIQEAGTGQLKIDGSTIHFRNYANSNTMANFVGDEAVELYYNNTKRFETTNTGATVTGILVAEGGIDATDAQNNTRVGATAGDSFSGTTPQNNTLIGYGAGTAITEADNNTAVGSSALEATTTGVSNDAFGMKALQTNTTGAANTAVGYSALEKNTTGQYNVGLGHKALEENTTASNNTAVGCLALDDNTTGGGNAALGYSALTANTEGNYNVALGSLALDANTTGGTNTAVGYGSLGANTTAGNNVAIGYDALGDNTTASHNVAVGRASLSKNTTGTRNVAVGNYALELSETSKLK